MRAGLFPDSRPTVKEVPPVLGITTPHLIVFAITATVIIVIPGPSVLFIVSRAMVHGPRSGVVSVLGNSVGEYIQVVAVAFGVGALAERSVALFSLMKLAGGAYLIYLGWKTFRARRHLASALQDVAPAQPDWRSFVQGVTVGVSNPKTVVFLAAILPQFVSLGAGHIPAQILFLGLIFSMIALISDSVWALAAGALHAWLARSPRRFAMVGGAGGLAIMTVGAGLLLSGRKT
jgi:threonine/homoserine/homoserine lactone efflux protein